MPDIDRISNLYFGALRKPLEIRVLQEWTSNFRKKDTWFIIVDKHVRNKLNHKPPQSSTFMSATFLLFFQQGDAIQLLEQKKMKQL